MFSPLLLSLAASTMMTRSPITVGADQVCYPPLGCFSTGEPWSSPSRPLPPPDSPETIATRFFLFTRDRPDERFAVTTVPEASLINSSFSPTRATVFVVHGFAERPDTPWMLQIKDALLQKADVNVFLTDWWRSFRHLNYLQAAANARVVGAQIARLIQQLGAQFGMRPEEFHIIGFSMGAHVASYAGKALRGLGKITALDPAQPGFEGRHASVRLAPGDAEYVEVLHTSGRPFVPLFGFGMVGPHGHVDYYINNGAYQPGCVLPLLPPGLPMNWGDLTKVPITILNSVVGCDHNRSREVYIEALLNTECTFWGHPATTANQFLGAQCTADTCLQLRFETRRPPMEGSYVVPTASSPPFCIADPRREAQQARVAQTKLLDINERVVAPLLTTVVGVITNLFGK